MCETFVTIEKSPKLRPISLHQHFLHKQCRIRIVGEVPPRRSLCGKFPLSSRLVLNSQKMTDVVGFGKSPEESVFGQSGSEILPCHGIMRESRLQNTEYVTGCFTLFHGDSTSRAIVTYPTVFVTSVQWAKR